MLLSSRRDPGLSLRGTRVVCVVLGPCPAARAPGARGSGGGVRLPRHDEAPRPSEAQRQTRVWRNASDAMPLMRDENTEVDGLQALALVLTAVRTERYHACLTTAYGTDPGRRAVTIVLRALQKHKWRGAFEGLCEEFLERFPRAEGRVLPLVEMYAAAVGTPRHNQHATLAPPRRRRHKR